MTLGPLRRADRRKPWPGLVRLIPTVLSVTLLGLFCENSLPYSLPQLCAAIRCRLIRSYIFFTVNLTVLLLFFLKLLDDESGEDESGGGRDAPLRQISHDVWFDASSSTASFGDLSTIQNDDYSTPAPPADCVSDHRTSGIVVSFLEPFRDATADIGVPNSSFSFLEPTDSFTGGSGGSDEFHSCPSTPSRLNQPASSPFPAAIVSTVRPSAPPMEEIEVSMDSTWKMISRRDTAALDLKNRRVCEDPSPVQFATAAGGRLTKSKRFQSEEAASPRREVPEKITKWKEGAVLDGPQDQKADRPLGDTQKTDGRGGSSAKPRPIKKSNTWHPPPAIETVLPEAWAKLRKASTMTEKAAGASPRVLENRMKGRELSCFVEDVEEVNRRCDDFIRNFRQQLKLQRMASLRRQLYRERGLLYSP